MLYRCCSRCKTNYPHTKKYFALDKRKKSGLSSQCRKCRYAGGLMWRRKNKEKCREYAREFYRRNKEKEYARVKKYGKTFSGCITKLLGRIKQRCNNPKNPRYCQYGGRGIKLCFNRNELLDWLQTHNVNPQGLEIHRMDNNGDYTLDNIRFLAKSEHTILHNKGA